MLLQLFWMFLKLGFISVGGGYPMLALILQTGQQAVGLTAAEFADMAALELLASGPVAINSATYIGYIKAGLPGAAVATLGVCIGPVILSSTLYFFVARFRENQTIAAALDAVKIACGGVLVATALILARNILLLDNTLVRVMAAPLQSVWWGGVLITALCVVCIRKFKINPIVMILVAGALGGLLNLF